MRVLVNHTTARGQRTGIGHYTAQLVEHLAAHVDVDAVVPYDRSFFVRNALALWKTLRLPAPHTLALGPLKSALRGLAVGLVAQTFRKSDAGHDLYLEPNYLPWPSDLPTVTTWHDLSVLDHPEWHPVDRVRRFDQQLPLALKQTRHFLADSEWTRQGLIARFDLDPQRVTTVPLGVRQDLGPLPREAVHPILDQHGLPKTYFLHVGTVEPRKNLLRLMRAYTALPGDLRERCPLLLVGAWGWKVNDVRDFYEREGRHRGVRHIGYLPDQHLRALYCGALALACPTLYEGFGLPPLEMLACGGPVLCSRADALLELVGDHAFTIDAMDEAGWRDALAHAIQDRDWLATLSRGGLEHARTFTWARCARETHAVFQRVLGTPRQARAA